MPWALEGAATPPPSLTFMVGKAGSWCQERKSPLLPGANADALVPHHRLERGWGGQGGGGGQLDGGKKGAVCTLRGEEEGGEQNQEKGQAERRLPLYTRDSCTGARRHRPRKSLSPFSSVQAEGPRRKRRRG